METSRSKAGNQYCKGTGAIGEVVIDQAMQSSDTIVMSVLAFLAFLATKCIFVGGFDDQHFGMLSATINSHSELIVHQSCAPPVHFLFIFIALVHTYCHSEDPELR